MLNYNNSIIYKIFCKNEMITAIYVGSTTNLSIRISDHKSKCNNENSPKYNFKLYKFIRDNGGFENFTYSIIEEFSCSSKNELLERERYYVELLNSSLNVSTPILSNDEKKNRRQLCSSKWNKNNYNENKNKILDKLYEKIECECGSITTYHHLARHQKTKKHLKFIENK
jgi:hypothetical protein